MRHPIQPLEWDGKGVIRFKKNNIIAWLQRSGRLDLNEIAAMDFPEEDYEQLAQLIGYSFSGWGSLSYVSDEAWELAAEKEAELLEREPHQ